MTPASGIPEVPVPDSPTLLTDADVYLFNEGSHLDLADKLGAHPVSGSAGAEKGKGTCFAVWAPNAETVSVMGAWNGWDRLRHPLRARGQSGIWEGFVPQVGHGECYVYHVASRYGGYRMDKADPFAFRAEISPRKASIVWDLDYSWGDAEWMAGRAQRQTRSAPMSIYEVHLGSIRRVPEEGNRSLSYRELAPWLCDHVQQLGFTHIEFMPVMEHPFYGSWGYQITGFYAPTSRYGTPQDLMFLIDQFHQRGIGVILDWVPSHFPNDGHGLAFFDGTHLYEHHDPRQGIQPEWNSFLFNYGRNEVRSFLLSNALFWLERYHADGLRVDAVTSMLHLDFARKPGEWVPNQHGGRENLEAISLLRRLNQEVCRRQPGAITIAEESTSWPLVTRPAYLGGLSFGLKWDMGWMHDTLDYLARDPIHRRFHHNALTFRSLYAYNEDFVLPLSHDEVVYGKRSLLSKMPGDEWQRFANLRLLFGYMYAQPGKKLVFMGGEFGQVNEWDHDGSLDWHLLDQPLHAGAQRFVEDLNRTYRQQPALHQRDCDRSGFEWIDANDSDLSVLSFLRRGESDREAVLVVCNFTPVPRHNYRVGVPFGGRWREVLNSDAPLYGGSGQGNLGVVEAAPVPFHGRPASLNLTLPPLGVLYFQGGHDDPVGLGEV